MANELISALPIVGAAKASDTVMLTRVNLGVVPATYTQVQITIPALLQTPEVVALYLDGGTF